MKHVEDVSRIRQDDIYKSFGDDSLEVTISQAPMLPLRSPKAHYQFFRLSCIRLENQLTKLEAEDVFAAMRNGVSLVAREFAETTILALSLFSIDRPAAMTFKHYDFSPRNILVSEGSSPLVTGILDFEFAGLYPNEEQFTNNAITNNQDWPEAAYMVVL